MGGGGVVADAAPLADIGTGTDSVSVLPDAGSELPADSDKAAAVRAAPLDEAVENALEVAGLDVGQTWFRMESEVLLPLAGSDFVRPEYCSGHQSICRLMSVGMTGFHLE